MPSIFIILVACIVLDNYKKKTEGKPSLASK